MQCVAHLSSKQVQQKFADAISYLTQDKCTLAIHLTALAILVSLGASLALGSTLLLEITAMVSSIALVTIMFFSYIGTARKNMIDDNRLKPYFLTAERMKKIEQELDKGNHTEMSKVINVAIQDNDFVPVLADANALSWFMIQLEKLIIKKALPDDHCEMLYKQFKKHWSDDQEQIPILCRSNWWVRVNKLALLLASPYYRTQVQSNFNDAKAKSLKCPDASYKALQSLNQYLCGRGIGNLSFADALDLLNLARFYQIKPLETKVTGKIQHILEARISKAADRKTCELILKDLQDNCDLLDDSIAVELQCKTLAKLYGIECHSKTPFYLFENCLNIPFQGLHLLQEKGVLEGHLKHVNCISIPFDISSSSIAKLKLYPEELTKFESVVLELSEHPDPYLNCIEIIKMLPNLKSIYLLPHDGVLNIVHINKIEKIKNLAVQPIKILFNVELVGSEGPMTELKIMNISEFTPIAMNVFKKFKFTNLSNEVTIKFECRNPPLVVAYKQFADTLVQHFNQTHAESTCTFKFSDFQRGSFTLNVNTGPNEQKPSVVIKKIDKQ